MTFESAKTAAAHQRCTKESVFAGAKLPDLKRKAAAEQRILRLGGNVLAGAGSRKLVQDLGWARKCWARPSGQMENRQFGGRVK